MLLDNLVTRHLGGAIYFLNCIPYTVPTQEIELRGSQSLVSCASRTRIRSCPMGKRDLHPISKSTNRLLKVNGQSGIVKREHGNATYDMKTPWV